MAIDSEVPLKVWAVIGPLIAAAASAVWSRWNQVRDRTYQSEQEEKIRKQKATEEECARLRTIRRERHREYKDAVAKFMASANEFTSRQCEWLTTPNTETKAASLQTIDRFNANCQVVLLLSKPETADLGVEVWNTALASAKSYNTPMTQAASEAIERCKRAKMKFLARARLELAELDEA